MKDENKVKDPKRHPSQHGVDHRYKLAKLIKWNKYQNKSKGIRKGEKYYE